MRQTFYEFCMLHERTNLLKEWDESRNFPLTPDTVSYGSKKKVWWTCENGHSWQTTVHVRSEGSGCPYCTGRKVLPGFNDLGTLYPDVAAQWDREKNGSLSPRDVSTGSKIRIWWRCPEGHSWQAPRRPPPAARPASAPIFTGAPASRAVLVSCSIRAPPFHVLSLPPPSPKVARKRATPPNFLSQPSHQKKRKKRKPLRAFFFICS